MANYLYPFCETTVFILFIGEYMLQYRHRKRLQYEKKDNYLEQIYSNSQLAESDDEVTINNLIITKVITRMCIIIDMYR